jgi:hypothetical protein
VFAASIAIFPSNPLTPLSASEIEPEGTATKTTSASEASPPSRPGVVTVCPACSQRRARPPAIVPLPIVVIFMIVVTSGLLETVHP